jgi:hypothetical protein
MRTNLEKRVQEIERQTHVRKWPNRPLTLEEEEYLFKILSKDFSQPGCHLSGFTAEQRAELREWYTKKLQNMTRT